VAAVITVETAYTDAERMQLVPGATYQKNGSWHVPLSWGSCLVLRGVFGSELTLGAGLRTWGARERARVQRMLELRDALAIPAGTPGALAIDKVEGSGTLRLRAFQRADVAYLVVAERALLAAPMGAGKSPVAIRALQVLASLGRDPFPALVIAPSSVKQTVWGRELAKWAPELSVSVVDGSATARRKQIAERADVTVINWESARLHSRVAGYGDIRLTDKDRLEKELNELAPHAVIMDEAHRLRDPKSAQSRAVKWLAHRARFRYALTGTPVDRDASDLWGLLHVVAPEWHPGRTRYLQRYVETGYSLYGGLMILGLDAGHEPEFRAVTQPLYRRIPKAVILPELPPKLPVQTRLTPMTPKQAKAYREMESGQLAILDQILVAKNPLSVLTRLLQFAAAHASVEIIQGKNGYPKQKVTLTAPSAKVDDLMELLEELGDEPLVVVAVSAQLIALAEQRVRDAGVTCSIVTGAQNAAECDLAVQRFQDGADRVIMLTLGAGAEGLTLTRARVILFMQESWQPLLNDQAAGRIHRIGSEHHESVQVIKQIAPGTVEERKKAVLKRKGVKIEEVLQDREAVARLLGGA
jgi:SNF2 family DNA or RNA helicase